MEIIYGEGGQDSKLFVADLFAMYLKYAARKGLTVETWTREPGHVVFEVTGRGAGLVFAPEAGKHCIQRVPPTERSGRRQTSFVTVAVLPLPPDGSVVPLPERELDVKTQTGKQGAGGQNVNKVASAVRMTHKPTGLRVFVNGRDQGRNRQEALRILTAKVNDLRNQADQARYTSEKGRQLADRGRGDKMRTYNFMKGFVKDHLTDKEVRLETVLKGNLDLLR